jgi:hypothetical protein
MDKTVNQNRSMDLKNKGARTDTAIVSQSWMSSHFTPEIPIAVAIAHLKW